MSLTKEQLEQIKQTLLKEEARLEMELAEFTKKNAHNRNDYNASFPDLGTKDDENAAEVSLYSDYLTIERTLEKDLHDVKSALKRLAVGTYGTCRYCSAEISLTRLLARPVSASCVKCKEDLKAGKK